MWFLSREALSILAVRPQRGAGLKVQSAVSGYQVGRQRHPNAPSGRKARPKPNAVRESAQRHPKAVAWPWHVFSEGALRAVRAAGFTVMERADGYQVQSRDEAHANLLHVRRTAEGHWIAQAAGNTPIGRTAEFNRHARGGRRSVDNGSKAMAGGGFRDDLVKRLRGLQGTLLAAHRKHAPSKPTASRIGSGLIFDPDEKSSSMRAARAGLPSLGKRR